MSRIVIVLLMDHRHKAIDLSYRLRSKSSSVFECARACVCVCVCDRLCGLVVRVLGYRSGGPGSIPGTTKKKSSGSGTGTTQPREYN
jgi:hypothetical protein